MVAEPIVAPNTEPVLLDPGEFTADYTQTAYFHDGDDLRAFLCWYSRWDQRDGHGRTWIQPEGSVLNRIEVDFNYRYGRRTVAQALVQAARWAPTAVWNGRSLRIHTQYYGLRELAQARWDWLATHPKGFGIKPKDARQYFSGLPDSVGVTVKAFVDTTPQEERKFIIKPAAGLGAQDRDTPDYWRQSLTQVKRTYEQNVKAYTASLELAEAREARRATVEARSTDVLNELRSDTYKDILEIVVGPARSSFVSMGVPKETLSATFCPVQMTIKQDVQGTTRPTWAFSSPITMFVNKGGALTAVETLHPHAGWSKQEGHICWGNADTAVGHMVREGDIKGLLLTAAHWKLGINMDSLQYRWWVEDADAWWLHEMVEPKYTKKFNVIQMANGDLVDFEASGVFDPYIRLVAMLNKGWVSEAQVKRLHEIVPKDEALDFSFITAFQPKTFAQAQQVCHDCGNSMVWINKETKELVCNIHGLLAAAPLNMRAWGAELMKPPPRYYPGTDTEIPPWNSDFRLLAAALTGTIPLDPNARVGERYTCEYRKNSRNVCGLPAIIAAWNVAGQQVHISRAEIRERNRTTRRFACELHYQAFFEDCIPATPEEAAYERKIASIPLVNVNSGGVNYCWNVVGGRHWCDVTFNGANTQIRYAYSCYEHAWEGFQLGQPHVARVVEDEELRKTLNIVLQPPALNGRLTLVCADCRNQYASVTVAGRALCSRDACLGAVLVKHDKDHAPAAAETVEVPPVTRAEATVTPPYYHTPAQRTVAEREVLHGDNQEGRAN